MMRYRKVYRRSFRKGRKSSFKRGKVRHNYYVSRGGTRL